MSELIGKNRRTISHLELLITASAVALMASATVSVANATDTDADQPTVWIELGGQLERIDTANSIFTPAFFDHSRQGILAPMIDSQKQPAYGLGGDGKVSIKPHGSKWVFSAALRYGRANGGNHLHHESSVSTATQIFPTPRKFAGDGQTKFHESHFVLDFQAGNDIGLGLFGAGSSSILSGGVRFAQFNSSAHVTLHAQPYIHNSLSTIFPSKYNFRNRHLINYNAAAQADRNTHAIGPSLAWDASARLGGSRESAVFDFDWGANAAILFGRQKSNVHQRTVTYRTNLPSSNIYQRSTQVALRARSHSVTIPNIGGFAGFSVRYPNAKISFGYRADFFFNAVDQGYDTRKTSSIGFYGPFATISIGLGG